ncbi:phage holin [Staphylococcus arlettae]|uniref:phage holin n=1 Tax=Staphylococcus arlettae TaxID=29378 RepID=UPI0021D1EE33|nr:phage holin [Staphylococcus arlettae]UXU51796.1 phage holin [Staphylococcus arlettae]
MKINWKVRLKKKSFWMAIISAILLFANNITQAFGVDYTTQIEQISNAVNGLLAILVGVGVVDDMTTKGISDSKQAQQYSEPKQDK